ncbi:glucosidase 2 subunit beta-like protein 1 [Leptotrombidium deliense]|uniref:Glucosidase 2 subunit beta n=1 Tax=Leptotrombidium deliense TaxID=299467 RepID=A0A443S6L0_9ACAR|nr:glucosidase 2 subunit beta-like protein 1 [Leptotrombidium deliense]
MGSQLLSTALILAVSITICKTTEVLRPHGVPLSKKIFYDPSKDFSCLDGSGTIPFRLVNDDYCDCKDGSDEPGTSACPEGIFHCINIGFQPQDIPSSRVNDGICDCCDTSDEYNSTAECKNDCDKLGKAAHEAYLYQQRVFYGGKNIRDTYIRNAKKEIEESQARLEQLRQKVADLEAMKNEKEALKKAAEVKEKVALANYKAKVDRNKRKHNEQEIHEAEREDREQAASAFLDLDANEDEILHYSELQSHIKFDQNGDGVVSDDEAKFFLHMKDEMDLNEFQTIGWQIMKPYYFIDKETTTVKPSRYRRGPRGDPRFPTYDYPDLPDEMGEDQVETPKPTEPAATPDPSVPYDDETKQIIDVAKLAKEEFAKIDAEYQNAQSEMKQIETLLQTDFGPDNEFMALRKRCFEFRDRQYLYTFCPFQNCSQKSSEEGATNEVSLGNWVRWSGPDDDKYSAMKFEGGQSCWNGPARSVQVYFSCGETNHITGASEPSRCEYRYDFETPAVCTKPFESPDEKRKDKHEEL